MTATDRRGFLAATGATALAGLAGCSDGGSTDPEDRGPISIAELAFAAARPAGYGEYEPQPDATYTTNDVVWVYVEVADLAGEPIDSSADGADGGGGDGVAPNESDVDDRRVRIDLQEDLLLENPEGDTQIDTTFTFQRELHPSQLDGFFVANDVILSGDAATGTYRVQVTMRDRVSESSDSAEQTFEVEL